MRPAQKDARHITKPRGRHDGQTQRSAPKVLNGVPRQDLWTRNEVSGRGMQDRPLVPEQERWKNSVGESPAHHDRVVAESKADERNRAHKCHLCHDTERRRSRGGVDFLRRARTLL